MANTDPNTGLNGFEHQFQVYSLYKQDALIILGKKPNDNIEIYN